MGIAELTDILREYDETRWAPILAHIHTDKIRKFVAFRRHLHNAPTFDILAADTHTANRNECAI